MATLYETWDAIIAAHPGKSAHFHPVYKVTHWDDVRIGYVYAEIGDEQAAVDAVRVGPFAEANLYIPNSGASSW